MGKFLGQYIRERRKASKLSSEKLSIAAGISKSYLDYIECGMREPQTDVLAKIATALNGGEELLNALIEQQNKDRFELAQNKLRAKSTNGETCEVRSAARDGSLDTQTDAQALLAKAIAAFHDTGDPAKYAEDISDPNLRAILVAGAHLSAEQLETLRKTAEVLFPNAFKK